MIKINNNKEKLPKESIRDQAKSLPKTPFIVSPSHVCQGYRLYTQNERRSPHPNVKTRDEGRKRVNNDASNAFINQNKSGAPIFWTTKLLSKNESDPTKA